MDKNKMGESHHKHEGAKNEQATSCSTKKSDAAQNKSCHTGKCSSPRSGSSDKPAHQQDESTGTC